MHIMIQHCMYSMIFANIRYWTPRHLEVQHFSYQCNLQENPKLSLWARLTHFFPQLHQIRQVHYVYVYIYTWHRERERERDYDYPGVQLPLQYPAKLKLWRPMMLRCNSCGLGAGSLCFQAHSPSFGCTGTKPRPSIPTAMECSYEPKCSSRCWHSGISLIVFEV